MKRIGLTGGIGSGKSSLRRLLQSRGYACLDADAEARELLDGGEVADFLLGAFGQSALTASGAANRHFLREEVFSNEDKRALLEAHMHPLIQSRIEQKLKPLEQTEFDLWVFYEASLLIEKSRQKDFDRLILVTCPWDLRLQRLEKRGVPRLLAEKVAAAQLSDEEKRRVSHHVVVNDGDLSQLGRQLDGLVSALSDDFSQSES